MSFFINVLTGKDVVFDRIQQKYGKKTTFVAIGDGPEEEAAAKRVSDFIDKKKLKISI